MLSCLLVPINKKNPYKHDEAAVGSSKSLNMMGNNSKEPDKLEEASDKSQNNIVASLAEKAMSVASPVVPTREDGEVDQERFSPLNQIFLRSKHKCTLCSFFKIVRPFSPVYRLLAMLADLGQRGGILRLVGKVALLWGGLRGAMSLTDKLILFLRLAERPLIHR